MPTHNPNHLVRLGEDPVFSEGLNAVVQHKYGRDNLDRVEIGDHIDLAVGENNKVIGVGKVLGKIVACKNCLPESVIDTKIGDLPESSKLGVKEGDEMAVLFFEPYFPFSYEPSSNE